MLELRNVVYSYNKKLPGERRVLDGISMHIKKNTVSAIIGHTGSGKSTLIRHFNGLLRPDEGQVFADGEDIWQKGTHINEVRRKVGMVFQYPEQQLFEETVYKDIAFGPRNMGLCEAEVNERVNMAMDTVRLCKKYLDRSPFSLSGGEKRRAAIAGVIAMRPKALILDEPSAGLDPRGRAEILSVIKDYHRQNPDAAVVFVSHSMEDVAETADYVFAIDSGRLRAEGSVGEIFSQPEILREMGLDIPKITELAAVLNEKGFNIQRDIYTVNFGAKKIFEALNVKNCEKKQE
ncbi:MAG: energy-coupling factor transporter ATPase [Clostridiales bacterium]|nr:energy-coupling factor transporter ATPase [Clostridiales bacterium]